MVNRQTEALDVEGRVYHIRVPTSSDVVDFHSRMSALGARASTVLEELRIAKAALDPLVVEGADPNVLDFAQLIEESLREFGSALAMSDMSERHAAIKSASEIPDELRRYLNLFARDVEALDDLQIKRERYLADAGSVVVRHFMEGWEGLATPFRKSFGGRVPDDVAEEVPASDLAQIGAKFWDMMTLSEERKKNLAAFSSQDSDPTATRGENTSARGRKKKTGSSSSKRSA